MLMSHQHQHDHQSRHSTRVRDLMFSCVRPPRLQGSEFILAVVAVLFIFEACLDAQPAQSAGGANQIVIIKQMHFDPSQVSVQAGDTVEWKNEDIFSHSVTADDGSFDSELIAPGHSWQMTFKSAQTIAYHCRPHPNMTATLMVQGQKDKARVPTREPAPPTKMLRRSNGRLRKRRRSSIQSW